MASELIPSQKLLAWYTRKSPVDLWLDLLRNAECFEDWEEAALHLDNLLGLDLWYHNLLSTSSVNQSILEC
jgi:TAG lipase / lysophosphatidylethanolamine acyltransferase